MLCEPPPQPRTAAPAIVSSRTPRRALQRRARTGIHTRNAATTIPPARPVTAFEGLSSVAVVAAAVLTVSVAVAGALPVTETEAGTVQVGRSVAPDGLAVRVHVKATLPVNPPPGVTVRVEFPLPPGVSAATALILKVKLGVGGGAVTVSATVVAASMLPDVPETVRL